jgi:hypothetical protein
MATDARRLAAVRQALVDGVSHADIKARVIRKFRCSERQVLRYIEQVTEQLLADGTDLPTEMLARLYQKATKDKKFSAAATLLKRIEERSTKTDAIRDAFARLGPLPLEDPLAIQKHAQKIAILELDAIVKDPTMSPEVRRAWIVKMSRVIAQNTPNAELYDAKKMIKDDDADKERPKAKELEHAPLVGARPLRAEAPRGARGRRPLRPPPA